MNKVIEAVKKDGTRALIPTSLVKEYADAALSAANGRTSRATKNLCQMIANLMYVRGYISMTEIRYDSDGGQRRILMMAAR